MSPFFTNYRFKPDILKQIQKDSNNLAARIAIDKLTKVYDKLKQEISFINEQIIHYTNKKRIKGPSLKEEDQVYLIKRNIKT